MIIHKLASQLKLAHESKGNGKLKDVKLMKKQEESKQAEQSQPQQLSKQQRRRAEMLEEERKAKLNQQKKNQLVKQQQQQFQEMDDDAFLDMMINKNKYCNYTDLKNQQCKIYVEVLGHNCPYCDKRYCLKHNLPETHGCDEAAKVDAKAKFKAQQYQQLTGMGKLNEREEAYLKQKLQDKIKKSEQDRNIKTKKQSKK